MLQVIQTFLDSGFPLSWLMPHTCWLCIVAPFGALHGLSFTLPVIKIGIYQFLLIFFVWPVLFQATAAVRKLYSNGTDLVKPPAKQFLLDQ